MNAQAKDRALWLAVHNTAAADRDPLPNFTPEHARTLRRAERWRGFGVPTLYT